MHGGNRCDRGSRYDADAETQIAEALGLEHNASPHLSMLITLPLTIAYMAC
jgi:hypothetical protein